MSTGSNDQVQCAAKTNESLPPFLAQGFQAHAIKIILSRVISHYDFPICCLALQTSTGMTITGNYGIDAKYVEHPAGSKSILLHDVCRPLPIIIYDASKDARFYHDPLVVGSPFVRLFIGVPVMLSPNTCIGTLCLMHNEPHQFFSLNDCQYAMQAAQEMVQHFLRHDAIDGTLTLGTISTLPTCSSEKSLLSSPGVTPPTTPRT